MRTLFAERRAWMGLGVLLAVLLVATGWFALIGPLQADTASLASQETDARDQNVVLAQRISVLKRDEEKLPALRAALGSQVRGLPAGSGLPELTRQLTAQARTARVDLTSVAVGAIAAVVRSAPPAAAGASASPAGQLFAIPVTITTTGAATSQIAFLAAVQQDGPRRALLVSTQLAPSPVSAATAPAAAATSIKDRSTMTTVLTVFSAPLSPDDQAQLTRLIAGPSTS
ncbi:hypothetical protein V3N99_01070 [Dermatophilaceae bacterium Soc4.6]